MARPLAITRAFVATQFDFQHNRPISEVRDLLCFLRRVGAKPVGNPDVSSNDIEFHCDLQPADASPPMTGESITPFQPPYRGSRLKSRTAPGTAGSLCDDNNEWLGCARCAQCPACVVEG